jgi:hypothetical protein
VYDDDIIYDGGLNQILRRQTSRSHYGSKVPAVTVTVFKYRNKIDKIVVKSSTIFGDVNVKNIFTSHIDKTQVIKKNNTDINQSKCWV